MVVTYALLRRRKLHIVAVKLSKPFVVIDGRPYGQPLEFQFHRVSEPLRREYLLCAPGSGIVGKLIALPADLTNSVLGDQGISDGRIEKLGNRTGSP